MLLVCVSCLTSKSTTLCNTVHAEKGTTNLTFFLMKNIDPLMGAKLKSKTNLLNKIFDFSSRFLRVWLQS
jgi:hypothetical protein